MNPMIRRSFLTGSISALSVAALESGAGAAAAGRRPNIIFILADDLGYGDTATYGQKRVRTPNIDALAKEGMKFTQGYAGAPVCGPSRGVLMTGKHAGHARIRDNFALAGGIVGNKGSAKIRRANLTSEDKTVAQYLQASGYKTGLMGKWHLDGYDPKAVPNNFGFGEFKGWLTGIAATQGYWPEKRMHDDALIDIPENAGGRQGKGQGRGRRRESPDGGGALLASRHPALLRLKASARRPGYARARRRLTRAGPRSQVRRG